MTLSKNANTSRLFIFCNSVHALVIILHQEAKQEAAVKRRKTDQTRDIATFRGLPRSYWVNEARGLIDDKYADARAERTAELKQEQEEYYDSEDLLGEITEYNCGNCDQLCGWTFKDTEIQEGELPYPFEDAVNKCGICTDEEQHLELLDDSASEEELRREVAHLLCEA